METIKCVHRATIGRISMEEENYFVRGKNIDEGTLVYYEIEKWYKAIYMKF